MTKSISELAREAADKDKVDPFKNGFWVLTTEELQRFHDLAIAQYRESLLAGVGEAVAYKNQNGVIHEAGYEWGESNELTPLYTADQLAAAVAIEREKLAAMDWTTTLREGALVTWGDAETLGDRVAAAIRGQV